MRAREPRRFRGFSKACNSIYASWMYIKLYSYHFWLITHLTIRQWKKGKVIQYECVLNLMNFLLVRKQTSQLEQQTKKRRKNRDRDRDSNQQSYSTLIRSYFSIQFSPHSTVILLDNRPTLKNSRKMFWLLRNCV